MSFFKFSLIALCLVFFFGCGGGGSDSDDNIVADVNFPTLSGTWSGESRQESGLSCSDGSFIGAGVGTGAREIRFEIAGADAFDQEGTLQLESCVYSGSRQTRREMEFFSSDSDCLDSVVLFEIEDGETRFVTNPRVSDSQEVCDFSRGGEVFRQG